MPGRAEKIDPLEVLGIHPKAPLPYWGWGTIPDQYGRRWADDDGQGQVPTRPSRLHAMLLHAWPGDDQVPALDLTEVRAAIATEDAPRFLTAMTGRDIDDALQQVGSGMAMALEHQRKQAESLTLSIINRLTWRASPGDQVLADDLLARLRGEPPAGRLMPVDLDMLSDALEGDLHVSTGGYVDLVTGDVLNEDDTDPGMVGDDAAIDVEAEPDRFLRFDKIGSHDGWEDMAHFVERQRDQALRERLQRAIDGKGAFRRFRDVVHEENLAEQWYTFSADRQQGRARDFLADHGIRVG